MFQDFLARLSPEDRTRLESIGQPVRVGARERLLARGDPGGDVYRVDEGTLEAVDRRSRPEVVLDVMVPGDVVGELAFIDGRPRSVDIVADTPCRLTRWPAAALWTLLDSDPGFAVNFWRALAEEVTERVRFLTFNAVTGGLRGPSAPDVPSDGVGEEEVEGPAREVRDGLAEADRRLRRDPADTDAVGSVHGLLERLQDAARALDGGLRSPEARARLARTVAREVHPYLLPATTAHLCLSRPDGFAGGGALCAHLLANDPRGDGPLAAVVDAWLLGLPRAAGMRSRAIRLSEIGAEALSGHTGPVRMLLIHSAHGPLLSRVRPLLAAREGEVGIVEPTREALASLDVPVAGFGPRLRVRLLQDPLADLASGGSLRAFRGQDLVVLDSLFDYLPARPLAQALRVLRDRLAPGGRLVATALSPASDAAFWRFLLDWPVIGRDPRTLVPVLEAEGFAGVGVHETEGAGLVLEARAV
ncbi:MAG: cyclic nucleotide-binding domain-containing protein [Deltaproteobacteria bacterium]|nr:cyclic nucleotide-binding domain-containing protein [Deltaproteobacteria bacterium]